MQKVKSSAPHLPHSAIVKAPGLLPMQYRLGELAEALAVSPSIVHRWMDNGLPYTRDGQSHLWFNGTHCKDWIDQTRSKREGPKLAADEAYCLRCSRPVKLHHPSQTANGRQMLLTGKCPVCDAVINRGVRCG